MASATATVCVASSMLTILLLVPSTLSRNASSSTRSGSRLAIAYRMTSPWTTPLNDARLSHFTGGYPWAHYGTVGAEVERVSGELRNGLLRVELRATSRGVRGVRLSHGLAGSVEVQVERLSPARLLARSLSTGW